MPKKRKETMVLLTSSWLVDSQKTKENWQLFCSQRTALGPGESYTVGDSRNNVRQCFLSGPPESAAPEDTLVYSRSWQRRHCREQLSVWIWLLHTARFSGCVREEQSKETASSWRGGWGHSHWDTGTGDHRLGSCVQIPVLPGVTQDWKLTLVPCSCC